jgi:hypothetical protein
MLLFSERTWKHHCVTLVLPFAVLCYYLAAARPGPWLRGYLLATLGLVLVLMLLPSLAGGRDAAHRALSLGKQAQVYGAYVAAYLLLIAAQVVLLRQRPPRPAEVEAAVPLAA